MDENKSTATKAHFAGTASGAAAVLSGLAFEWLSENLGPEGAVAAGTILTALVGWGATYLAPANAIKK